MLGSKISHLKPDHERLTGSAVAVPGYLEEASAEKEDEAGIAVRAELTVDSQT
jgi:hypothetical protein